MRLRVKKIGPKGMKADDDGTNVEDPSKVEKVTFNKKPLRKRLMKRG